MRKLRCVVCKIITITKKYAFHYGLKCSDIKQSLQNMTNSGSESHHSNRNADKIVTCYICDKTVKDYRLSSHLYFSSLQCRDCGWKFRHCKTFDSFRKSTDGGIKDDKCVHRSLKWTRDPIEYLERKLRKEIAKSKPKGQQPSSREVIKEIVTYLSKLKPLESKSPWKYAIEKLKKFVSRRHVSRDNKKSEKKYSNGTYNSEKEKCSKKNSHDEKRRDFEIKEKEELHLSNKNVSHYEKKQDSEIKEKGEHLSNKEAGHYEKRQNSEFRKKGELHLSSKDASHYEKKQESRLRDKDKHLSNREVSHKIPSKDVLKESVGEGVTIEDNMEVSDNNNQNNEKNIFPEEMVPQYIEEIIIPQTEWEIDVVSVNEFEECNKSVIISLRIGEDDCIPLLLDEVCITKHEETGIVSLTVEESECFLKSPETKAEAYVDKSTSEVEQHKGKVEPRIQAYEDKAESTVDISEHNSEPSEEASGDKTKPTIEPYENKPEPKVEPYESKPELAVEPYENKPEPKVEPYKNKSEPKIEPHENKLEPKVEPYENKSEPKIEPYENKSAPAVEPYENESEPSLEPYENESEHTLEPYEDNERHDGGISPDRIESAEDVNKYEIPSQQARVVDIETYMEKETVNTSSEDEKEKPFKDLQRDRESFQSETNKGQPDVYDMIKECILEKEIAMRVYPEHRRVVEKSSCGVRDSICRNPQEGKREEKKLSKRKDGYARRINDRPKRYNLRSRRHKPSKSFLQKLDAYEKKKLQEKLIPAARMLRRLRDNGHQNSLSSLNLPINSDEADDDFLVDVLLSQAFDIQQFHEMITYLSSQDKGGETADIMNKVKRAIEQVSLTSNKSYLSPSVNVSEPFVNQRSERACKRRKLWGNIKTNDTERSNKKYLNSMIFGKDSHRKGQLKTYYVRPPDDGNYYVITYPSQPIITECPMCYFRVFPAMFSLNLVTNLAMTKCVGCTLTIYIVQESDDTYSLPKIVFTKEKPSGDDPAIPKPARYKKPDEVKSQRKLSARHFFKQ